MTVNNNKIKPEDVKIFSQTYESAGGKDMFSDLVPLGFIHLHQYGTYHRSSETTDYNLLRDETTEKDIDISSLLKVSESTPIKIVKYALAKLNITHLFNYTHIDEDDYMERHFKGDAYRKIGEK